MMCFNPKVGHLFEYTNGKRQVLFSISSKLRGIISRDLGQVLVPCGKCVECEISHSNEWGARCAMEAKMHKENCMLTLTYNEENVPFEVDKRVVQLFIKRLRRRLEYKFGKRVRYFACGEYGKLRGRPHYHVIIFGWRPHDLTFLKYDNRGNPLYRSNIIEELWQFGFSSVGLDVTADTAKYCAKYLQKTVKALSPNDDRNDSFTLQSRKPALGWVYLVEHLSEVFENDGRLWICGREQRVPYALKRKCVKLGIWSIVERCCTDIRTRYNNCLERALKFFNKHGYYKWFSSVSTLNINGEETKKRRIYTICRNRPNMLLKM